MEDKTETPCGETLARARTMRRTRTAGTALIGKNIHRVSTKVRDTPGGLRPLGVAGWNLAGEAFQIPNLPSILSETRGGGALARATDGLWSRAGGKQPVRPLNQPGFHSTTWGSTS